MRNRAARWVRGLLWSRRDWSPARDREFHDQLFAGPRFDPFTFAYPGYITIRRFADLAAPHLPAAGTVLDLGCGPAEITCELASRRPQLTFVGVDHSLRAIERAFEHAQRLSLTNISFEVADVERFEPSGECGAVMMFDAFHHLVDPASFVERMGRWTPRFILVEPRGGALGEWRKDLDFDWLPLELEKIRARIAWLTGERAPAGDRSRGPAPPRPGSGQAAGPSSSHASAPDRGAPVEHRYGLPDFERFFAGYGLDIRGTVAGLERYVVDPLRVTPSRERFGRLAHDLLVEVEEALRASDADLLAKHWVICATKGGSTNESARARLEAAHLRDAETPPLPDVRGPYDAAYHGYRGPTLVRPDEEFGAAVRVVNRSWMTLSSADLDHPIFLSYHWLDRRGGTVVRDGLRTPLPRPIGSDETCEAALRVRAPAVVGQYQLAIDLVHEGTSWFSDAGVPFLAVPVAVRGSVTSA